jgi:hypothetical protein
MSLADAGAARGVIVADHVVCPAPGNVPDWEDGQETPFYANHGVRGGEGDFEGGAHAYVDGHAEWQPRAAYPDRFYLGTPEGPHGETGNGTLCHHKGTYWCETYYWVTR